VSREDGPGPSPTPARAPDWAPRAAAVAEAHGALSAEWDGARLVSRVRREGRWETIHAIASALAAEGLLGNGRDVGFADERGGSLWHQGVRVGEVFRHVGGARVRVSSLCGSDEIVGYHRVRRDGQRDRRFLGTSGMLEKDHWTKEPGE
jgi:hypothetical protein